MIFEIEFVLPDGDFEIWKFLRQVGEKFFGGAELNFREDCVTDPEGDSPDQA